ncbi:MAG TPA: hypothetical protein PLY93_03645 [Turneriella sp.]|nr:hypothetical protein [Turneriella sp.]
MKKIITLLLSVSLVGMLSAQQPAGTDPRNSQPIVVGGDTAPESTSTVRTISTRKAYTATTTIPETTTTVIAPDKVLVRESALSWLSLGVRVSADYHPVAENGSLSCLWLYGEFYNTNWGIEMGVGKLYQPLPTSTTTYSAGERSYWTVDAIFKYYWWFARSFWIGAGLAYNAYGDGYYVSVTKGTATSDGDHYSISNRTGQFLWQAGLGVKVALGSGFNVVHFDPNIRVLGGFNNDSYVNPTTNTSTTLTGIVLRLNLGFTYSFGL